jgi:DNA polymerase-3 subunit alpha
VLDDLKLIVNISDLDPDFIHKLASFFENKGDNHDFEIMELEKVKKIREVAPIVIEKEVDDFVDENDEYLNLRKPLPCC